ncbi:peptidyl-tRNA hydrolase [Pelagophyceae sp. CCMP2097]|nr:peptidyl-tRNA hydrolase [Pelagophyceae sp. CCMP2097]
MGAKMKRLAKRRPRGAVLVVGLASWPGGRRARHDVGAALVERFVAARGGTWALRPRLLAYVAELDGGGVCVAPLLPYNCVGLAVRRCAAEFGAALGRVFVVHDDLELAAGSVRRARGGSGRGNNGVKSVAAALGMRDFQRIRVGVGRPAARDRVAVVAHVLGGLPAADRATAEAAFDALLRDEAPFSRITAEGGPVRARNDV